MFDFSKLPFKFPLAKIHFSPLAPKFLIIFPTGGERAEICGVIVQRGEMHCRALAITGNFPQLFAPFFAILDLVFELLFPPLQPLCIFSEMDKFVMIFPFRTFGAESCAKFHGHLLLQADALA